MWQIFTPHSKYKNRARIMAIIWSLLIFFLCFIPVGNVPEVDVPMADKWVHFVLFGVFAFLWLCAYPSPKFSRYLQVFIATVFLGVLVEELQGLLAFLGRSKDYTDALADIIGGVLGELAFFLLQVVATRRMSELASS